MTATETVHGCAVAIGDKGLLILGASGTGKSRLVLNMLTTWTQPAVRLVADDRVVLSRSTGKIIARPHPLITGQIESRGAGIMRIAWLEAVVLHGVLQLVSDLPPRMPEKAAEMMDILGVALPSVTSFSDAHTAIRLRMILPFLRDKTATDWA